MYWPEEMYHDVVDESKKKKIDEAEHVIISCKHQLEIISTKLNHLAPRAFNPDDSIMDLYYLNEERHHEFIKTVSQKRFHELYQVIDYSGAYLVVFKDDPEIIGKIEKLLFRQNVLEAKINKALAVQMRLKRNRRPARTRKIVRK